jgi:hypothetical protein
VLCGALQLLVFLGSAFAASLVLDAGSTWTAAGHGVLGIYARAVMFGAAVLLGMGVLPITGTELDQGLALLTDATQAIC